ARETCPIRSHSVCWLTGGPRGSMIGRPVCHGHSFEWRLSRLPVSRGRENMLMPWRQTALAGILLFLLPLPLPSTARAQEGPLQGLDAYITQALRDWEVPGLAVAVVKNDRLVFAKGYGVRRRGDPTPVTEKTLFAIASCSKA